MTQAPHGSEAAGEQPDEDVFAVPEAWAGEVDIRRGKVTGTVPPIDQVAARKVRRRLAKIQPRMEAALVHERTERDLVAPTRAYLDGEPDPLGAAVVGALIWSLSDWDDEKCEAFTDVWASQHDLAFAVAAAAELSRVIVMYFTSTRGKRSGECFVMTLSDDQSASGFDDIEGVARRTRELLAVADETEYQQAVAALTQRRRYQYQRVVTSYLVPERTDWLDELLATQLTVRHARTSPLLLGALSSDEQFAKLRERQGWDAWSQLPQMARTVAEGVGPALVPTLIELLDGGSVRDPADRRRMYDVLAAMPGDAAFAALVSRIGKPGVQAAVLTASERFPLRALRLLAGTATGASRRANLTRQLLRGHLESHPALLCSAVPGLPEGSRKAVNRAILARGQVLQAALDTLPQPLVTPVWTSGREDTVAAALSGVDMHLLPQLLLAGRLTALPVPVAENLVTLLVVAEADADVVAVRQGLDLFQEVCDPVALDEFVWALFREVPDEQTWPLAALKRFGGDTTVRGLVPLIRVWPRRGYHVRARAGLDVLAAIGSDVALTHLNAIARKTTHQSVQRAAFDHLGRVAAGLGLTAEQFSERFVPDFGLNQDGSATLDYGVRRFTAGFDEQLRPFVTDSEGRRRKSLPRPGVRDDQVLAPLVHRWFAGLKKDVRMVAADQIQRMERAMVAERRWPLAEFRARFADHPLLWHIARRLVWTAEVDGVTHAFRLAEDRTLADVNDDTLTLADSATVGIAHPVRLADLESWAELFADYELLQPFPQLDRPQHTLGDEERDSTDLKRFHTITVPTGKVLGLEQRGWRRAAPQGGGRQPWVSRQIDGGRSVVIGLEPGIAVGSPRREPEQTISYVQIHDVPGGSDQPRQGAARFGDLDPVTSCELLADLVRLTENPLG